MNRVDLPPLTNLSVYQKIYCDQELTDHLCRYVWDTKPDFICRMAEQKLLPFPQNHDDIHAKECSRVEYYLWDEIKAGRIPELSMLAMIDFMYEIDRRVRKGLGLPDIPVVGSPLAASPDGPFPELINKPIYISSSGRAPPGVTQELIDKYALLIYQSDPMLMYAFGEQARRFMRVKCVGDRIYNLAQEIVDETELPYVYVLLELRGRLGLMCNLPSYEQMKVLEMKDFKNS